MLAPRTGGSPLHRLVVDFGAVPVRAPPAAQPEPAGRVQPAKPAKPIRTAADPAPVAKSAKPAAPDAPDSAPAARLAEPREPPPLPRRKPAIRVPRLIAIDAGHGGADPGAIAADGVQEKDLVLTFSRESSARRSRIPAGTGR